MNIRDKILIVEDERSITNFLRTILVSNDYDVIVASSGAEAYSMITSHCPDLIVLDLGLPDIDGLQIIKSVREWTLLPIVVVSARAHERDKVQALDLGADDYISKPFSLREVIARVKAVLRRTVTPEAEKAPEQITYQTLVIDITKKKVSIDGEEVALTKKEFEILFLLLQNKGRVFSREDILARVWSDEVYVLDRTIDVNITRLRKKIGVYGKCIVTRLGYGYCFEAE